MPIHTEPVDKKYLRITDTYEYGDEVCYGIAIAQTPPGEIGKSDMVYYIIETPSGLSEIHPIYACTEITKKEYFLGVLKGNV